MSQLTNRVKQLEKDAGARRIVVRYADKTTPAELQALRADESITLIIVEYADNRQAENEQP